MAANPNAHPNAGAYSNSAQVAADISALGPAAQLRAAKVVQMYGMILKTRIQANASGRPGPRVVTGDYRRSWHTRYTATVAGLTSTVGTMAPQARRLEFGMVGSDRAGRMVNQAPLPHVAPALSRTAPEFLAAMSRIAP